MAVDRSTVLRLMTSAFCLAAALEVCIIDYIRVDCKVFGLLADFIKKGKGSPYSTAERRVPELITVLGRQHAGNVSHKPGVRLPLLSVRPALSYPCNP